MLETLSLPSGQTLTYRQYGQSDGRPVFFFHGWPGESHQASLLHRAALAQNIRLISPNRPGIGGSTPQPGRTLLDWPPLVAALADSLHINRFHLCGVSGGGPYAHACAIALADRLIAYTTVCGALPAAPGPDRQHLSPVYRVMLGLHDRVPLLLKSALFPISRLGQFPPPRPLLWLALRTVGPSDRDILWPKETFPSYFPAFQNAMRSGTSGLWEDGRLYAHPWPFLTTDLTTPLTIWHGHQDRNFSCAGAAAFAATLPHATFIPTDDGHYSILVNQADRILENLMSLA